MHKFTAAIFVFLITVSGSAQDSAPPANSVFFGYSRRSVEGGQQSPAVEIANGWGLSFDHMFNPHIGLTAEFAGQYGRALGPLGCLYVSRTGCYELHDFASHQFLFGPRFAMTGGRMTAFAHPMVGFSRLSGGAPQTNFIMGFGGGLDIAITRRIAIRAFQADYVPERVGHIPYDVPPASRNGFLPGYWRHNLLLQSGVVFRFGRK
jgi:hypothetical protein